jgi:hypothetical protein
VLGLPKKPIRDSPYAGKRDKKDRSKEGILVGYSDSDGHLRVNVYFSSWSSSE